MGWTKISIGLHKDSGWLFRVHCGYCIKLKNKAIVNHVSAFIQKIIGHLKHLHQIIKFKAFLFLSLLPMTDITNWSMYSLHLSQNSTPDSHYKQRKHWKQNYLPILSLTMFTKPTNKNWKIILHFINDPIWIFLPILDLLSLIFLELYLSILLGINNINSYLRLRSYWNVPWIPA